MKDAALKFLHEVFFLSIRYALIGLVSVPITAAAFLITGGNLTPMVLIFMAALWMPIATFVWCKTENLGKKQNETHN
jgi:hypothetical protein